MSAHPICPSQIPPPPSVEAISHKPRDMGYARNGIHERDMQRIELFLGIYRGDGWVCYDCSRPIHQGTIIGRNLMRSGIYCLDCMILEGTETLKDELRALELSVKLKRKSSRHPQGLCTVYFVGTTIMLADYKRFASDAGYPVITEKETNHDNPRK